MNLNEKTETKTKTKNEKNNYPHKHKNLSLAFPLLYCYVIINYKLLPKDIFKVTGESEYTIFYIFILIQVLFISY